MKNKFKILTIALLIMTVLITGCSKKPKLKEGVMATVNGIEIMEEEYDKLLSYYLSELRAMHDLTDDLLNKDMGTGMTLLDSLKSDVLDSMIISEIISSEATKNNIEVDEEDFKEAYEYNHETRLKEDEDYKATIEENKLDEDFIKAQIKKDLLGYNYKVFYLDELEISDEAARTFYDENPDFFHLTEIKARHILVDDEDLANDLIKKIEEGEDFIELAKEHSTEPGADESGGDLGYFDQSVNFVPEFKEAVFAMEVGELSQPVRTDFGYHVILVEDKVEEHREFEDVTEAIKHSLKETDYQKHVENLFESAKIVRRDDQQ